MLDSIVVHSLVVPSFVFLLFWQKEKQKFIPNPNHPGHNTNVGRVTWVSAGECKQLEYHIRGSN